MSEAHQNISKLINKHHPVPKVNAPVDKSKYPIFAVLDHIWAAYPKLHADCSGFLKKAAQDHGVPMSHGNANEIVAWLATAPGWLNLGKDPARAASLAAQGFFVAGGETETGHGHVVVVVPGWSATGHPMGYWGQLHGVGATNKSLSFAWMSSRTWDSPANLLKYPHKKGAPSPLDEVLYFAYPLQSKLAKSGS